MASSTTACSEQVDATGMDATPDPITAERTFMLVQPPAGQDWTGSGVVSHDGTVVAGFSGLGVTNATNVYRWSATGGPHGEIRWLEPPGINPDPAALLNLFSVGLSTDAKTLLGLMARQDTVGLFRWDEAAGMTDLGAIPGRGLFFTHIDMSDDGAIVMATDGQQAFRWTSAQGRLDLGQLTGDVGNEAIAMSANGQVIVGNSVVVAERSFRVFRWTAAGGIVPIEGTDGSPSCETRGHLSDDGKVLFGVCKAAVLGQAQTLFRWTEATGTETIAVTDLPYALVMPWHVSGDGAVLVGWFARGAPPLPNEPPTVDTAVFRWTSQAGLTQLVPPTGLLNCSIQAASSDGTTVVGGCNGPGMIGLVRWDASGTAAILEPPPGFKSALPKSVTADGHVVAGYSQAPGGTAVDAPPLETAVVWDDRRPGPMLVADLLTEAGIPAADFAGVLFRNARVSRDGHTFIGDANDASGRKLSWLARVP